MTREWNLFLDQYPLVLSPFLMRPTYPWDYDARGFDACADLFRSAIYSTGVNYLSLPAGVVPIGLVDDLPAGVQLIGRRYREDLILDAMESIEQRVGVLVHRLWERETQD
jgi:amidase